MHSDPNMSDTTLLVSVEDLINRAMGPPDVNVVNFKLIQMVLQILARQQRMLKQRVEIKVSELADVSTPHKISKKKSLEELTESSSSKSPQLTEKRGMAEIKEEREKYEKAAGFKQKEREELKEKERTERTKLKEQEKAGKTAQKEQGKAEQLAQKEQEKAKKVAIKEQEKAQKLQEKAEKAATKEQIKVGKVALKEQEKSQKGQDKAQKAALKEQEEARKGQEKTEKAAMMEQEKAGKVKEREKIQKKQEKTEKRDEIEKEKVEKQALKEKEKYLQEAEKIQKQTGKAEKEAEKEKKRSAKEQEKADKEKARVQKEEVERDRIRSRSKSPAEAKKEQKKAVTSDDTGISIKEILRGKESVLVVEKGPTTRSDSRSRKNIDVVTQSQFALLEAAVRQLKNVAVPKPLAMPDNKKLRSDLAKGTASLPDTMQAMQVGARVKAAEAAIDRMTGLLTQLTAAGALPDDANAVASEQRDQSQAKRRASLAPKKMVLIDPKASQTSPLDALTSVVSHLESQPSAPSSSGDIPRPLQTTTPRASILSRPSIVSMGPGVTHEEMNSALRDLKEEIYKNLQSSVSLAATTADNALHTAMSVANKLDVALKLDVRVSSLFTLVSDYAEQLSGFDAGLTTQMQSFKDQIGQMRTDLQNGLAQFQNVNNKAETAAVMELTERYTELVGELDTTLNAHNSLQQLQGKLGDELHSLVECVEMLREQKCDKDEVLDGLRDKADISRLSGLLSEAQFAGARADFERRLDLCHEKFRRQDAMWTTAIKDLSRQTDQKAELIELLSWRDLAQNQLQEVHNQLRALANALGEPKAALLTRLMSRGAKCGACGATALMEPRDAEAGAPHRLPPLRAPPAPEPCSRWLTAEPPLERHTCHRWVGGSHTLLQAGGPVTHESAGSTPAALDLQHVRKFTGYGDDGRIYMMEEDLQPCIECNMLSTNEGPHLATVPGGDGGAGDAHAHAK